MINKQAFLKDLNEWLKDKNVNDHPYERYSFEKRTVSIPLSLIKDIEKHLSVGETIEEKIYDHTTEEYASFTDSSSEISICSVCKGQGCVDDYVGRLEPKNAVSVVTCRKCNGAGRTIKIFVEKPYVNG